MALRPLWTEWGERCREFCHRGKSSLGTLFQASQNEGVETGGELGAMVGRRLRVVVEHSGQGSEDI
ncbi:MAG: hypothetical protein AAGA56_27460, partial [Myxococcota bacterium]